MRNSKAIKISTQSFKLNLGQYIIPSQREY